MTRSSACRAFSSPNAEQEISLLPQDFWFLRHGETDWNIVRRFQGISDIPLNAHGRAQAVAAAELLTAFFRNGEKPFDRLISSPLGRAHETAQTVQKIISEKTGIFLPLSVEEKLIEVNFGIKEGTLPDPADKWYSQWVKGAPPPQGAESFHGLQRRVLEGMNKSFQAYPGEILMFVAHGAVFRSVRGAMALPPEYSLPNATPVRLSPPGHSGQSWHFDLHRVDIPNALDNPRPVY